jgi:hypothetical protein
MGRKRLLPGLTVKDGYLRHPFDIAHDVETSGLVLGQHLATGHPTTSTPRPTTALRPRFSKSCARAGATGLVAPPEDYSFIDIGAGMGRGLLIASHALSRSHRRGAAPDLAAMAQKNIEKWKTGPRPVPDAHRCQDVTEFEFPAQPCRRVSLQSVSRAGFEKADPPHGKAIRPPSRPARPDLRQRRVRSRPRRQSALDKALARPGPALARRRSSRQSHPQPPAQRRIRVEHRGALLDLPLDWIAAACVISSGTAPVLLRD